MPVSTRYALLAVWLCFVARGAFHAAMLPLWEGFDEYAHMAVIEHWMTEGSLPRPESLVPDEIVRSLQSVPVSKNLLWIEGTRSYSDNWRPARNVARPGLPALNNYEAQQPPLYYWLLCPAAWLARDRPLPERVQLFRMLSVLMASTFIPLTFLLAHTRMPPPAALLAAALAALLPGLEADVCRIGNDALAITLFALFLLAAADRRYILTGVVLGLGLLTKATFLAAIPALLMIWIWQRAGWRKPLSTLAVAAVIGAWWYIWIHGATGSWSGWLEAVARPGQPPLLLEATHVNWLQAADAVFRSFLWFGDWSFLTVRRWMYYLCGALLLICGVSALPRIKTYFPEFAMLGWFAAAMAYNVVITHRDHGISASSGWYWCTLASALMVVITAGGLRWIWLPALLAAAFVMITLYGETFLSIPYYYGVIAYNASGALPALHLDAAARAFPVLLRRMPLLSLVLWPAAIAANAALLGIVTGCCARLLR